MMMMMMNQRPPPSQEVTPKGHRSRPQMQTHAFFMESPTVLRVCCCLKKMLLVLELTTDAHLTQSRLAGQHTGKIIVSLL